ncbi:MAG: GntR family transcriptional regulator [Limnochordaceae bacterium]|nr:GntR family transcriptional regulator [Limnochordaceae bacterium]
MSPLKLDNYKPLRELVFEALREAIISGALPPGERLMEVQLADELGVSRTPVREAIRKLEHDGFVVMIPRKGAYVADISLKDVAEIFDVRKALEALAAQLAAERASDEDLERTERVLVEYDACINQGDITRLIEVDTRFHEAIYQMAGNSRLKQMLSLLSEQVMRYRTMTLSHGPRMRRALEEHRRIVEAIAARDGEKASRLARDHIESAENALMELIARSGKDQGQGMPRGARGRRTVAARGGDEEGGGDDEHAL